MPQGYYVVLQSLVGVDKRIRFYYKWGILSEFFGEFIDLGDEIGERFSAYVECDVIIRNGIRKSRLGVKSKGVYEFTCNRKVCEILV